MKRKSIDYKITREFLSEAAEDEEETGAEEETEAEEEAEEDSDSSEEPENTVVDDVSVLDSEIESVLIDFESSSMVKDTSSEIKEESFIYESGISVLNEEDSNNPNFDIGIFAGEVARLIKNYENLLDMEALLLKRSQQFVSDRYGQETSEQLADILDTTHGISLEKKSEEDSELKTPLAVGASPEAAAAS